MTNNGIDRNAPRPRLCHLRRWDDFDGYGFNLHSDRTKQGQFVGKVDRDSPAESAGLRKNDRIVEVNFAPIGIETHRQVVERIKEGVTRNGTNYPEEVLLLVVDEDTDEYYKSKNHLIRSSDSNVEKLETEIRNGAEHDNESSSSSNRSIERRDSYHAKETSSSTKSNEYSNVPKYTDPTPTYTRNTSSPAISRTSDQADEQDTTRQYTTPVPTKTTRPELYSMNTYTNTNSVPEAPTTHNVHTTNSSHSSSSANGSKGIINLEMSAAEYREKLKAQKSRKHDPRQNQQMSMKEKRDIIDRL